MLPGRNLDGFRETGNGLPVYFNVIGAFYKEFNLFGLAKCKFFMEIDQHIMAIHFPEYRKKRTTFCSPVLHHIAHVNIKIAWIPDPRCFLRKCGDYHRLEQGNEEYFF
ncbi:hypothetical protein D3C87_793410 [compost metagenome]